jgi:CBS-domain-containing membrane protein
LVVVAVVEQTFLGQPLMAVAVVAVLVGIAPEQFCRCLHLSQSR